MNEKIFLGKYSTPDNFWLKIGKYGKWNHHCFDKTGYYLNGKLVQRNEVY